MPTQLLDQTKELILLVGRDGRIRYANKTAIDRFFISESLRKETLFNQLILADNSDWLMNRIIQSPDKTVLEEIVLLDSEGRDFFADLRIIHYEDQVALYITDLTHQMKFRDEQAQKVKVIESLSKSALIRDGELEDALKEVMRKSTAAMEVARITLWLFDDNYEKAECIGSIIENNGSFLHDSEKGVQLFRTDIPNYFEHMLRDDVVVTDNVMHDLQTAELVESYLAPNGISSMLDVPLRSNGKLTGVMCFEHTGKQRKWNVFEIKFGILIAQLVTLILEGIEKNKLISLKAELLNEKERLMQEIKFRVHSSFSLVNALINYQYNKLLHSDNVQIIEDVKNHIYGVSSVHELLLEAVDYNQIRFEKYILRILGLMEKLYQGNPSINVHVQAPDVVLPISKALPSALIIFELLNHSYKESLKNSSTGEVQIIMQKLGNNCKLVVSNNDTEVSEEVINRRDTLYIKLVDIFVQELNGVFQIEVKNGNRFTVLFPIND